MTKLLILGVCAILAGAIGFFGERFIRPSPAAPIEQQSAQPKKELLFKMPLGKFTMQILQSKSAFHIVFDIDVYVMGASSFEEINGAVGRARLRDATVAVIADLAETDQSLADPMDEEMRKRKLATEIVRRLHTDFPAIRTARVNSFSADLSLRE